jgi:hypothetical protein
MKNDINYLALNRDSLIQIAKNELLPIIEKKGGDSTIFNPRIYTIRVFANTSSIIVRFILKVKYVPINSNYYGAMFIELKSKTLSIESLTNSENKKENTLFYTRSPLEYQEVKYVINVIQKWGEFGDILQEAFNDDFNIYEQSEYYKVIIQSVAYYSSFKIRKEGGEIYDDYSEQLEPDSENEIDPLIEITK